MRPDTVLVNVSPGETRIALLARGQAVEFLVDRPGRAGVEGAVFAGRVRKINRDLNAAFVDIGTGVDGYLAAGDARRRPEERIKSIADVLGEGDRVLVQADREALDGKGPRLTCRLILSGRFAVLNTGGEGLTFDRGLAPAEKQRLEPLGEMLPGDLGLSFHPAAGGAATAVLEADVAALVERLDTLGEEFETTKKVPALLLPPPSVLARALALAAPNARVIADAPGLDGVTETWTGPQPLFEAFGVEAALEAALTPAITLPSGGRLIISETPALTAVDVDSGATTGGAPQRLAAQTNREAVKALARELRLRNLGGQIVIDFLTMKGRKDQHELLTLLRGALAGDPVECHVLGFTALGLVEMTRRRRGPSLYSLMMRPGAARPSAETAALAALRAALAKRGGIVVLKAAPDVATLLKGDLKGAFDAADGRLGGALRLETDAGLAPAGFEIAGS